MGSPAFVFLYVVLCGYPMVTPHLEMTALHADRRLHHLNGLLFRW
jgi:hypothetical protein